MNQSNGRIFVDFEKSKEQVYPGLETIAATLRGELNNLHPITDDCCIWRVPAHTRSSNENFFTPRIVSIGPIHHDSDQLKEIRKEKIRCLNQFLGRTSVTVVDFLSYIKYKEAQLRNSYEESFDYSSDDFVSMVLLDAVFLLELFLRYVPEFQTRDRVFKGPGLINDVVFDIFLLENQLPMFILEELFVLAQPVVPVRFQMEPLSMYVEAFFYSYVRPAILMDTTLIRPNFSKAKHILDLLWLCLQPPNRPDIRRQRDSEDVPSVTQLHLSGMKFELGSTKQMLDMKLDERNHTLQIPKLIISGMTLPLLKNLQAFERSYSHDSNHVNDYNIMLSGLLNSPEDVERLAQAGVIESRVLDSEGVLTFFKGLGRDARVNYSYFYYSSLAKDLRVHSKSKKHQWKAYSKQNYFTNPWVFGGTVVYALIMLFLAIAQVASGFLALGSSKHNKN